MLNGPLKDTRVIIVIFAVFTLLLLGVATQSFHLAVLYKLQYAK